MASIYWQLKWKYGGRGAKWLHLPPLFLGIAVIGLLSFGLMGCASEQESGTPLTSLAGGPTPHPVPTYAPLRGDPPDSPLQISGDLPEEYRYSQVTVGDDHSCGLLTSGEVMCWGSNGADYHGHSVGQSQPPSGEFINIDAGYAHTCGVRVGGAVECWGSNYESWNEVSGQSRPPHGEFKMVSAGKFHTCGVRTDNKVMCWGSNQGENGDDVGQSRPLEGEFESVSAGDWHSCGVRVDGSVACWGSNYGDVKRDAGQARPPQGEFLSVVAGTYHTCGIEAAGAIKCWGDKRNAPRPAPQQDVPIALDSGMGQVCAIYVEGSLMCWTARYGWGIEDTGIPNESFSSVSSYRNHTCGVLLDGTAKCWGDNSFGKATPPEAGGFKAVTAAWEEACVIRHNGQLECWGETYPANLEYRIPDGPFTAVSAGTSQACGLRPNGRVECWGDKPETPERLFASIHTIQGLNCGERKDGGTYCWGRNYGEEIRHPSVTTEYSCRLTAGGEAVCLSTDFFHRFSTPGGTFQSVTSGAGHACGLRPDGSTECWGLGQELKFDQLEGSYLEIASGLDHVCGLRLDNRVECVGEGGGPPRVSGGLFTAISAGGHYTCGVKLDANIKCWIQGYEAPGWVTSQWPPKGEFLSVGAGYTRFCAVRVDHFLMCWGNWIHGDRDGIELVKTGIESVSVDTDQFCFLLREGSVECKETAFGDDKYRYLVDSVSPASVTPPDNDFTSITVGNQHACGLRQESSVKCWGDNYDYIWESSGGPAVGKRGDFIGQAESPQGTFKAVSAGAFHTCGIRTDGQVECWGADFAGQSTPPAGQFSSISAGHAHTCGIRPDGSVQCWGRGRTEHDEVTGGMIANWIDGGESLLKPPDLPFVSVSVGNGLACGIVTDGRVKCWGSITR